MNLKELTSYMDTLLDVYRIPDASKNGLQIGDTITNPEITKVAFAVDSTNEVIQKATDEKADLLVVHHGIFWKDAIQSLKEFHYKKISPFFEHNLALYAVHLPLDKHESLGNNYTLAHKMGLTQVSPFGFDRDIPIGCHGTLENEATLDEMQTQVASLTGASTSILSFGTDTIKTIGIISGKANTALLEQVYYKKIDLFITGERSFSLYNTAKDLGLNVLFLGHYHSETFGIKALQKKIQDETRIETVFIDTPTLY